MSTVKHSTTLLLSTIAVASLSAINANAIPEGAEEGGIWVGSILNISPYANASWFREENPQQARTQKKEIMKQEGTWEDKSDGWAARVGADLLLPGNDWKVVGNVYYDWERYDSDLTEDENDWGESLAYSGKTDGGLAWSLTESVKQRDLDEVMIADQPYDWNTQDRLEYVFGGRLSKAISEKTTLGIRGSYSKTDYDAENLYDYVRYGGGLTFARKLTEKTDWTLSASHSIGEQKKNYKGPDKSLDYIEKSKTHSTKLMAGLRTRSTEKLSFNASAGIEFYEGFEDRNGDSDEETTFTYHIGSTWKATERLTIGINGLGEYEIAEDIDANSVEAKSIGLSAAYRPFERIKLTAGVTYRREDYQNPVLRQNTVNRNPYLASDAGEKRSDDNLYLTGKIIVAINSYASIFGAATYRDVTSSIEDFEYNRARYSIGAAVRY